MTSGVMALEQTAHYDPLHRALRTPFTVITASCLHSQHFTLAHMN